MKANVIIKNGEAYEVFAIQDLEIPKPDPDEILVKVFFTSVNPLDCKIRNFSNQRSFPITLGYDLYGEVVEVGKNVKDFETGDHIIASPSPFSSGANAEYICIRASQCLKVNNVDATIGAALPLAGITAYEALFDRLKISLGDTILIHAGAGGVGHLAIQLAKAHRCTVLTTASREESIAYCKKELKADHVINYQTTSFKEYIQGLTENRGISLILDTIGGDTFIQSLACLSPGGHICTVLPVHFDSKIGYSNLLQNITISYEFMGASAAYNIDPLRQRQILGELVKRVSSGQLKPRIDKIFNIKELAKAHEYIESSHTMGKIVISVDF